MSGLSLSVGDRVVYPNQGLCTVSEIKAEEIAGQRLTFVSLVFEETGATVKVPEQKLVKNGVRRVADAEEARSTLASLQDDGERASLDWKKRARDNSARLAEGGLRGLAEVVKDLQVLSELRPLPPKERGQYNDARHLLVEELSAALGITPADAEDALDVLLFPPGKERPRRSVEEFQASGDDELGLGDDLLGMGDEAPAEDEPEASSDESDEGGDEDDEAKPAKGAAKAKKAPAKAKAAPRAKKTVLNDLEPTEPLGMALPDLPASKKRGRPPKAKPAEAPEPKKRGRPPKTKAEAAPKPKARAKSRK